MSSIVAASAAAGVRVASVVAMDSGVDGVRGGSFYDDPDAFARYRAHRRGVRSPNDVME